MRAYTKYNFDKLELYKSVVIQGSKKNIRQSADNYCKKYNVKIKVKPLNDGCHVTLIDGEHLDLKVWNKSNTVLDNFMTKSDMIILLDDEQIETLIAHRNNLDYRVINNIDLYTDKCVFFEKSREITKFINQNNNVK